MVVVIVEYPDDNVWPSREVTASDAAGEDESTSPVDPPVNRALLILAESYVIKYIPS